MKADELDTAAIRAGTHRLCELRYHDRDVHLPCEPCGTILKLCAEVDRLRAAGGVQPAPAEQSLRLQLEKRGAEIVDLNLKIAAQQQLMRDQELAIEIARSAAGSTDGAGTTALCPERKLFSTPINAQCDQPAGHTGQHEGAMSFAWGNHAQRADGAGTPEFIYPGGGLAFTELRPAGGAGGTEEEDTHPYRRLIPLYESVDGCHYWHDAGIQCGLPAGHPIHRSAGTDESRDWDHEPDARELGLCDPPQLGPDDYPEDHAGRDPHCGIVHPHSRTSRCAGD